MSKHKKLRHDDDEDVKNHQHMIDYWRRMTNTAEDEIRRLRSALYSVHDPAQRSDNGKILKEIEDLRDKLKENQETISEFESLKDELSESTVENQRLRKKIHELDDDLSQLKQQTPSNVSIDEANYLKAKVALYDEVVSNNEELKSKVTLFDAIEEENSLLKSKMGVMEDMLADTDELNYKISTLQVSIIRVYL